MIKGRTHYLAFNYFLLILFFGCSSSEKIITDCYSVERFKRLSQPRFEAHVINLKPADSLINKFQSRLDIYTQITWDRIRFIKQGENFEADYSLFFNLKKNDSLITSKEVSKRPRTNNYEATQKSVKDYHLQTFYADTGKYKVQIQLVDNISGLSYNSLFTTEARNFSNQPTLSNGLFLENVQGKLKPLFLNDIKFNDEVDTIIYYQELYNIKIGDSLKIVSEFLKRKELQTINEPTRSSLYFDTSLCQLKFDNLVLKNEKLMIYPNSERMQLIDTFFVPIEQQYLFSRKIIYNSFKNYKDTLRSLGTLTINNKNYPNLLNVNDSILATRYLLFKYEIDSLLAQDTNDKKRNWLKNWWREHGGIAKQNEFFDRVKDANLIFSSCDAGFKLPMGMVFIVCGLPGNVECVGMQTEVWQYLINNQTFNITFKKTNLDEKTSYFNLQPFTIDESLWKYSVDTWRRK
ncbi:MAG: GWxTD domain-containing protein [Bacteroidetes bacterium]|nr:GWxTD domain-containing protein [Bacteroidota bacterium]